MSFADLSAEPSATRHLTLEQKQRLTVLLEQYLSGLEAGVPPTIEELAGDDPALIQPLGTYVSGLEDLHRIAVGFDPHIDLTPPVDAADGQQLLGDFQLMEVIGRGGMGVVYRAYQASLDRIVAIKLLPVASLLDAKQIARFRNEAQAAACLQHPNIVPIHAVGCERGVHYFAMQFIDGQAMDETIASARENGITPDWREMTTLAIQAAGALHAAHEMGVVHRDVKPSNLIIDRDGKLWVTDFGLARYQTDVSLTQSGDIVGTMRYMSPEQARGESALVDCRTDVYSLGITLYEMLCLQPAHDAADAPNVLRLIDQDATLPLRQHRNDLPRDLQTVIAMAMSPSRDQRYETARAFAEDLQCVLSGQPTVARPPTLLDRAANWASKHQRSVTVTLLVALLGFIGLGIGFALVSAEKQISDANARRAQREKELARGAVDSLGSKMAELLADIPAAESVRRQLLAETLKYHQSFAAYADRDPELREDLAVTYGKIGMLQSELGGSEEAISALAESQRIYAELVRQQPESPTLAIDWSTSQNNLAQALGRSGNLAESAKWFARAVKTQERLLQRAENKDDILLAVSLQGAERDAFAQQVRLTHASTLNNLGLLLTESGANDEAEAIYLRAIKLLQSNDASSKSSAKQLAALHSNLSGLLSEADPGRAVDYARQALAQQTELLSADPGSAKLATHLMATLNTLGTSLAKQGQQRAAVDAFQRSIEIGTQLQQRWPGQPKYRRDLVISFNQMGLLLSASGELAEARTAFARALEHQRVLADAFDNNAEVQSMLGGVLNNLGFVQQQLGDQRAARSSYDEAVKYQTAATRLAPAVPRYREFLQKHQHNLNEIEG